MNSPHKKVTAALISHRQGFWAYDTLLACKALELYSFQDADSLFSFDINPFQLRTNDQVDVIYIASHTWRGAFKTRLEEIKAVRTLRKHCRHLILIDGWDSFDLSVSPFTIELFDLVLKTNGVYKDKDLYNWEVGCDYPGSQWVEKTTKKKYHYLPAHLDKVTLSFPCQVGVVPEVKRRLRKFNTSLTTLDQLIRNQSDSIFHHLISPLLRKLVRTKGTVFFLGDLGHQQRYDLLMLLKKNHVSGQYGVFRVLRQICGRPDWRNQPMPQAEYEEITSELKQHELILPKMNRLHYLSSIHQYKIALSPVGFGEMCFRHLEIMQMGKCGIIQDISHVDHYAPFIDGQNILFCKPDFRDLPNMIRQVEAGEIDFNRIGRKALADALQWEATIDDIFEKALLTPVIGKPTS